ncbi:ABC transporter permease [Oscillospiraceae bacterium MB08-C2-2]|nr:ABC transporter permease [Oscillospiraceae bacterium MB08-C2-2]
MKRWIKKAEDNAFLAPVVTYLQTNIGILLAFIVLFTALSFATPNFLKADNWINVLRQITTNANISIGVMLAIIINGIDLTVGAVIALSGSLCAKLIADFGVSIPVAVILGCLVGMLSGAITGSIITFTRMPPFVVTLAMQNICRGAAYLVADGKPIRLPLEAFEKIGTGYAGIIPLPVIYTAILLLFTFYILNKTKLGRHIYAVGGNREAARFSGIKTYRVEIFVYTLSGFLAAFSGIVFAARMASGQPAVGLGYETDAVAASVLGGASMTGGVGTVGGMFIGALVIGILSNGLNLIGVNSFWQYIAKGLVILIAVYIDMFRKRKERF